ncbi:MAG TPA: hypothetical protein VFL17_13235 [Anaerolineae bacterium]|nr:hypothetical protein [Anaerolineae bacterium]
MSSLPRDFRLIVNDTVGEWLLPPVVPSRGSLPVYVRRLPLLAGFA